MRMGKGMRMFSIWGTSTLYNAALISIWKLQYKNGALPAGNFEINEWLEDRKALKGLERIKRKAGLCRVIYAQSFCDSIE